MKRIVPITLLSLALGFAGLTACGTSADVAADATTPVSAASAHDHATPEPGVVDIELGEFTFTASPVTVDAGHVTIRARNGGKEDHQVTLGKARPGINAENFATLIEKQGEAAILGKVDWVGGPNAIAPGATQEAQLDLEPGTYLMVCFMPSPDGTSHVMKKMVSTLTVTDGSNPAPAPTADWVITATDFKLELPAGFDGKGVVRLDNQGTQGHELIVIRANPGKTIADAFAWSAGGQQGPPPYTFAGGIADTDPGHPSFATLDLPAGDYAALCFVPDVHGSGQPHAMLGMVTPFTVT